VQRLIVGAISTRNTINQWADRVNIALRIDSDYQAAIFLYRLNNLGLGSGWGFSVGIVIWR
jgi:hypothetical protein